MTKERITDEALVGISFVMKRAGGGRLAIGKLESCTTDIRTQILLSLLLHRRLVS